MNSSKDYWTYLQVKVFGRGDVELSVSQITSVCAGEMQELGLREKAQKDWMEEELDKRINPVLDLQLVIWENTPWMGISHLGR
jgi:hypothetical protein